MLNWYIYAQYYKSTWIDPQGHAYNLSSSSHSKWIIDNIDWLEEEYGIDFSLGQEFEDLISHGWIRMVEDPEGVTITINDFDDKSLRRIEDILFSIFSNRKTKKDEVWLLTQDQRVNFDWKDFIEEGVPFTDFVKNFIRTKGDF